MVLLPVYVNPLLAKKKLLPEHPRGGLVTEGSDVACIVYIPFSGNRFVYNSSCHLLSTYNGPATELKMLCFHLILQHTCETCTVSIPHKRAELKW